MPRPKPRYPRLQTGFRISKPLKIEVEELLAKLKEQGQEMHANEFYTEATRYFLASIKREARSKKTPCPRCGK